MLFLIATFSPMLDFEKSFAKNLVFIWILVFGVNVAGLTLGIIERKKNRKKALIGIIGHSLLLGLFLTIVISAVVMN